MPNIRSDKIATNDKPVTIYVRQNNELDKTESGNVY